MPRKKSTPVPPLRGRTRRRRWLRRGLIAIGVALLAPVPFILLFALVDPPTTSIIVQRTVSRAWEGKRPIVPRRTPIPRERMSAGLRRAVLASEDDRFYLHHGVDFVEMDKALERRKQGGRLRGASTLTQQVAKNIFLWNGRSFIRKGLELYLALWFELLLSKERILDLYLNLAEWGDGVFGAEAAARAHFGKSAARLTRDEAARLAAVLPSPVRWSPKGSVATRRAATILGRMRAPAPRPK